MKHRYVLQSVLCCFVLLFVQCSDNSSSDRWGDQLVAYATNEFMPAENYIWDWAPATLLRSMADRWEYGIDKKDMLSYIRQAMDVTMDKAGGIHPNAVASGFGMAFLARVTGEEKYQRKAFDIYEQYLLIPRASNGGVSHRDNVTELWDDTVYMISLFLIEMYRLTGDEKYLQEVAFQLIVHAEKLEDPKTGLWYHGWDGDDIDFDDECCMRGWSDNPERRGNEFWGRGNGWVAMTLANMLHVMPSVSKEREPLKSMFIKMMQTLAEWQDKTTGHWFQLPEYPGETGNFIESSCTAMFAYAMCIGIADGILPPATFLPVVKNAFSGIENFSLKQIDDQWTTVANVCHGTCIGDKDYYYARKVVEGTPFALGAAIMFHDQYHLLKKKK